MGNSLSRSKPAISGILHLRIQHSNLFSVHLFHLTSFPYSSSSRQTGGSITPVATPNTREKANLALVLHHTPYVHRYSPHSSSINTSSANAWHPISPQHYSAFTYFLPFLAPSPSGLPRDWPGLSDVNHHLQSYLSVPVCPTLVALEPIPEVICFLPSQPPVPL